MREIMSGNASLCLQLDFHDYWIAGSGNTSSPWLDEDVDKNSDGLPYYSGKALKGILRDAVRCAQAWGWLQQGIRSPVVQLATGATLADWPAALFGSAALEHAGLTPDQSLPGTLQIGDALLPLAVQQFLLGRSDLRAGLQRAIFATALSDTGTALNQSLRGMEVSVPLTLQAAIRANALAPPDWQQVLQRALPLVRALGKRRNRGFGRVSVSVAADVVADVVVDAVADAVMDVAVTKGGV
jgi:hypothetical protein